jgi:ParB-like chromosome segregation protein Spo0J
MTEEEIIVHQYAENEQRENLNALEKINVYLELKERGLTGKKIAQELSVSPAQITQGLKAGELPQEWLKKAVKACPDVSIYKLYNIAKIKTDRRREQSFNALINGVEVKSTPKEQEKPVKNEKFYTDAQLNFAWEKIKRKVRRDKQQLAKLIPPGKLDKFLEDYDLNED